jgi:ADP-heptose:LPS heptosyltransferase
LTKPNKILIIQTAFLGDVILATSLVEKLHSFFPDSEIHFLLKKGNETVLQNNPKLKKIWIFDKSEKIKSISTLISSIRNENYDTVINLHRFFSSGLITAFSGAKRKIGFSKNPLSFFYTEKYEHLIGNNTHEIERNNQLIENLTDKPPALPKLYPSASDYDVVKKYTQKPYICIAPASVWFTKQFPAHKWIELIKLLDSFEIYLLGAAQDKTLCEAIISKSRGVNLAGEISLLQSAALMQNAEMNYVNDSAPLHIASAIGAKVTAIFCSTSPRFGFGPLLPDAKVIETSEVLTCKPCGLHGHKQCPQKHFKCAETIKTEILLENIHH